MFIVVSSIPRRVDLSEKNFWAIPAIKVHISPFRPIRGSNRVRTTWWLRDTRKVQGTPGNLVSLLVTIYSDMRGDPKNHDSRLACGGKYIIVDAITISPYSSDSTKAVSTDEGSSPLIWCKCHSWYDSCQFSWEDASSVWQPAFLNDIVLGIWGLSQDGKRGVSSIKGPISVQDRPWPISRNLISLESLENGWASDVFAMNTKTIIKRDIGVKGNTISGFWWKSYEEFVKFYELRS